MKKGYALGIMTELFASMLSNADQSQHLRKWSQRERIANVLKSILLSISSFNI